jgi:uncharacterized protein with PQ loop repeat
MNGARPAVVVGRPAVIEVLAVLTAVWGIVFALAPLAQLRRVVQQGSSRQVSRAYFGALLVNSVLWLGYGAGIGNVPIMVANTAALVTTLVTLVVLHRYRNPAASIAPDEPVVYVPAPEASTAAR